MSMILLEMLRATSNDSNADADDACACRGGVGWCVSEGLLQAQVRTLHHRAELSSVSF